MHVEYDMLVVTVLRLSLLMKPLNNNRLFCRHTLKSFLWKIVLMKTSFICTGDPLRSVQLQESTRRGKSRNKRNFLGSVRSEGTSLLALVSADGIEKHRFNDH